MIKPTIGRVVWYWKNSEACYAENAQPYAALVTFVHNDELVNLATFDRNGDCYPVVGVPLRQNDNEPRPSGKHCEWMPYQKGQAAKVEAGLDSSGLEKRIAALEALVAGAAAARAAQVPPVPPALPKPVGEVPHKDGTGVA